MMIRPGLYQHYKGPQYRVIGTARHSETEELLVVYYSFATPSATLSSQACSSTTALYMKEANPEDPTDLGNLWVRPAKMFAETVSYQEQTVPRFKYIGD